MGENCKNVPIRSGAAFLLLRESIYGLVCKTYFGDDINQDSRGQKKVLNAIDLNESENAKNMIAY